MLDTSQRTAILELHEKGIGTRRIAALLQASRNAVRGVIASKSAEVPRPPRQEKAEPYRDDILWLYRECKGNLVPKQALDG
jgi:transposase